MVHELAHQWFEINSVQHWSDIWLNEGFTACAQWLSNKPHTGGYSAQQTAARSYARHPANDDFWTIPPGEPGVDQMFKPPVYDRGAMALHALRVAVRDKDFFTALRTWTTRDVAATVQWPTSWPRSTGYSAKTSTTSPKPGYSPPPAALHHQPEYQCFDQELAQGQVWRLGDAGPYLAYGIATSRFGTRAYPRVQVSEATLN